MNKHTVLLHETQGLTKLPSTIFFFVGREGLQNVTQNSIQHLDILAPSTIPICNDCSVLPSFMFWTVWTFGSYVFGDYIPHRPCLTFSCN